MLKTDEKRSDLLNVSTEVQIALENRRNFAARNTLTLQLTCITLSIITAEVKCMTLRTLKQFSGSLYHMKVR